MLTIRTSIPSDGSRVVQIWRSAVDATHDFLTAQDRLSIEGEVSAFLPSAPLWLAVDARDYATGFMLLSGSHMEALFVDHVYRGKGVGRTLVGYAISLHTTITTDVNEQNVQAVSFYNHLGFRRIGRSELDGQGRPYPLLHLRSTP
ncbi:acetyltransferase [Pseudoroseomonas globiformis]|uniref:Acetyltransferase n=1 Tax=Teichococcus globiformis TaxID=2307229 RepID=A0ABV7FX88_9PROT